MVTAIKDNEFAAERLLYGLQRVRQSEHRSEITWARIRSANWRNWTGSSKTSPSMRTVKTNNCGLSARPGGQYRPALRRHRDWSAGSNPYIRLRRERTTTPDRHMPERRAREARGFRRRGSNFGGHESRALFGCLSKMDGYCAVPAGLSREVSEKRRLIRLEPGGVSC